MDTIRLPINDAQVASPFEFAIDGRGQYTYLWIVVFSAILAFLSGVAMGSNDVSSSFAATVGSRTLSIRSALVLSAIFQILGSYFLGARVTKTVGKSVVNLATYDVHLDLLMTGMMVVLIMTSIAVLLATYKEFPISTTQCIISTIVGFGLASPGTAVNWNQVLIIFIAWLSAPILAATLSGTTFWLIRRFILRAPNPLPKVLLLLPFLTWFSIALNLFFVLFVSPLASQLGLSVGVGIGVCLAIGSVFGIILFAMRGRLERNVLERRKKQQKQQEKNRDLEHEPHTLVLGDLNSPGFQQLSSNQQPGLEMSVTIRKSSSHNSNTDQGHKQEVKHDLSHALLQVFNKAHVVLSKADPKTRQDVLSKEIKRVLHIHEKKSTETEVTTVDEHHHTMKRRLSVESISHLVAFEEQQKYFDEAEEQNPQLHQKAETFDPDAEDAFRYLQIFTSIVSAFAQGANSIGNISGPLSVIVSIYNTATFVSGDTPVDEWVTWLGIGGMVTGLFAFGYIVLTSVGVKMIHVTPSRGFSIALSASTIVAIGSFTGLPLSTTHCIIGSIAGVGLIEKPYSETGEELKNLSFIEGLKKAPVNWKFIVQVIASWFGTVVLGIVVGSGLFSLLTFSPSQIYPVSSRAAYNSVILSGCTNQPFFHQLSAQNCMVFYAPILNQTNVTYTIPAPANGIIQGLIGFSNNTVVPLS